MEKLDLSSFEKATKSLNEVIDVYEKDKNNAIIRDSMIQRFEYTYSLCLKMIKRFFSYSAFADENIEGITFNQMIRTANKMNLIKSDLEKWNDYRIKKNLTSHTYDEATAEIVASVVKDFYFEAEFLLNKLKEKSI